MYYYVVPLVDHLGLAYYVGTSEGALAVFEHLFDAELFTAIMNLTFYVPIGVA